MQEGLQKITIHAKDFISRVANSKSKTFLAFCFCFIAGVGFASLISNIQYPIFLSLYLYISIFLSLSLSILIWKKVILRFAILCLFFIILGVLRFTITIPNCHDSSNLCFYNNQKITFTGFVSAEPDTRVGEVRYTVTVEQMLSGVGAIHELPQQRTNNVGVENFQPLQLARVSGRVLIKNRLYPEYHYGDQLTITCRLQKPENKDDSTFRYDKYLARYGVWSLCNNAYISVISTESRDEWRNRLTAVATFGSRDSSTSARASAQNDNWELGRITMRYILNFKSLITAKMQQLWSEPDSSLMAGILFGGKSGLPDDLTTNFSRTGVTHIIAVSGFNITIIVTVLMWLLILCGLWRQQAYWVVIGTTILFVVFTGLSASAVRAAVMGIVVLTAQQVGRLSRMGNMLTFTVAVMLLGNPYLLVWDAGFQLSFLATLGLVYVSPVLEGLVDRMTPSPVSPLKGGEEIASSPFKGRVGWGQSVWQVIREPLLTTLSAILATLPLILYQFGRLSLVAPLVNILILWIIPWLMLFGFIATIFGFIFFPFGQLVAWITALGLKYVIIIVNWFGNLSWSAVDVSVPWWGMAGMYVVMICILFKVSHSRIPLSLGERDRG